VDHNGGLIGFAVGGLSVGLSQAASRRVASAPAATSATFGFGLVKFRMLIGAGLRAATPGHCAA
jgi:hypothetical protein